MKQKIKINMLTLMVLFSFSSCIKQIDKKFSGDSVAEFDLAVLNPATPPYPYYVSLRVPPFGLPVTTANSPTVINRSLTTPVKLRVNLVGPQRENDEVMTYKVLTDVTPTSPNLVAVQGTHFNTGTTFTIPAKSSFGEIEIQILNTGTASTNPREVHLEIVGNSNIKPSENYKKAAIRIAQN